MTDHALPPRPLQPHKSDILSVGLLSASFVFAFWPVWRDLISTWLQSEDASHGFLVLPVAVYLLSKKSHVLSNVSPIASRWSLLSVFLALVSYLVFFTARVSTLTSLAMVSFLAAAAFYLYRWEGLRQLAFPLFILLFMIQVPSQLYAKLTLPLQLFVSEQSVHLASALAIPVYRTGNIIQLPDRILQVVQACSGLRSIMSLLFLAALLGYFGVKTTAARLVLLASATPIAVLVNILRVFLLIVVCTYTPLDPLRGPLHVFFGVMVFCLGLAFLLSATIALAYCEKKYARRSLS